MQSRRRTSSLASPEGCLTWEPQGLPSTSPIKRALHHKVSEFADRIAWELTTVTRRLGLISNIDPGVAITLLHNALNIQTTYGAVMLSFLGALHWGFEFAGYGGYKSCVSQLFHTSLQSG